MALALKYATSSEALRRYIQAVRFQSPPYTISRDLLALVEAITPPAQRGLVSDLFTSIVLFDNQATAAVARQRPDGRYDVTITARTRKLRANGQGVETEVPIDDWIDVGVFGRTSRAAAGDTDTVLFLRKQHVTGHDVTVTATVDGVPFRAGIDPYNMLIDRTPRDNVRSVTR